MNQTDKADLIARLDSIHTAEIAMISLVLLSLPRLGQESILAVLEQIQRDRPNHHEGLNKYAHTLREALNQTHADVP